MSPITHTVRVRLPSGQAHYAVLLEDAVDILSAAPWHGGTPTGARHAVADVTRLAPVEPRMIFGIGKNYRLHAAEMGGEVPPEPLVFTKLPTSVVGPGETVLLPPESTRVDYEGELGVVIGRRVRRARVEDALDAVFGLTALCDVTARDLQARDSQWTRAKGFDTFCPVGPAVVTGLDPHALAIRLLVDGELRQHGHTRDMMFDVARLVAHLSSFCTLEPGDLIATGTPEGVGPLAAGNHVVVSIEGIGDLAFHVA
jgi:2-keto-4-pentenoate hydratase/2-oxohepta-3-ene-1,7-dioic acid hydratase in catechol pathway